MQKTNFPFEVLIHDDASTDGTADIIREYVTKYPDIIKPIYQTENQFSKIGLQILPQFIFPCVQSEYVALCEGDDYWTDPLKLQKQVDFLDANPDYTICFHPVEVHWEGSIHRSVELYPIPRIRFHRTTLTSDHLIKINFIQTNSVMYRWVYPQYESLDDWPNGILPGDWFLHLVHAKHGKIGFLPDVMGVYRRHDGGIWQDSPVVKHADNIIRCYDAIDKLYNGKYHRYLNKLSRDLVVTLYREALKSGNYQKLNEIYPKFPNNLRTQILKLVAMIFLKKNCPSRFDAYFNHLATLLGIRHSIKI